MTDKNQLIVSHAGIPAGFILEKVKPLEQAGVFKTAPELFPPGSITGKRHVELIQNAFKETKAEGITLIRDLSMSNEFRDLVEFAAGTLGCKLNEDLYNQPLLEHSVVTISGVGNSCWDRVDKYRNSGRSRKNSWHLTLPKLAEAPVCGNSVTYIQMMISEIFNKEISRLIFMGNSENDFEIGKQHANGVLSRVLKIISAEQNKAVLSYGHPATDSDDFCFDQIALMAA